jgi:hypothetical protein
MHLTLSHSLFLDALILGKIRIGATRAISGHGSILFRAELLMGDDHSGRTGPDDQLYSDKLLMYSERKIRHSTTLGGRGGESQLETSS